MGAYASQGVPPPQVPGCVPFLPGASGGNAEVQNIGSGADVPVQAISPSELAMLLKSIQAFVSDSFPKLVLGDASTRASRLHTWRVNVTQAINPAGTHLIDWWRWLQKEAEEAHKVVPRHVHNET